MTSNYTINFGDIFTSHGAAKPLAFFDGAKHRREIDNDVLSGSYFLILATRLNMIAANLEMQRNSEAAELNDVVKNLFYLHANYKIETKSKK